MTSLRCPACDGSMQTVAMACRACQTRVEGSFVHANEFAALSEEELHLLRVFVHCEGSIREMEAALGVSYPTVKAKLAALKQTLAAAGASAPAATQSATETPGEPGDASSGVAAIVAALRDGQINAVDAARLIRAARNAAQGMHPNR